MHPIVYAHNILRICRNIVKHKTKIVRTGRIIIVYVVSQRPRYHDTGLRTTRICNVYKHVFTQANKGLQERYCQPGVNNASTHACRNGIVVSNRSVMKYCKHQNNIN
jgi:hypothetical protein